MSSWTQLIKQISKEERNTSKPSTTLFGVVKKVKPFEISLGAFSIGEEFLTIPFDLRKNIEIDVKLDVETKLSTGEAKGKIEVPTALKKGDNVVLIRQEGGQNYVVLGRVKDDS